MATVKSDISLQVKNNLNRTATFSILGGTQDPSNGQANANTIYEWDLSAETFANTTAITIEASTITNPTITNYEAVNQDGAITDLETAVRILNTLNLGVFNLDGNTIWIIDDINVFGNIEILVSLSFDINVFVQEAYNYFDPLGKTPLVDFQTRYTSVIQQAVDTIPDFVDFVESQGWSLCYPTNAEQIDIVRVSAGSFFYVTDIGGVLTTNEATSGTSISQNGLENTLLYTSDITIWETLQDISFNAPLLPAEDCYIFKFIFEATIQTSFLANNVPPPATNGWIAVDSSYFVNAENQDIVVELDTDGALTLYGEQFPNVVQPSGYDLIFRSINDRIELIPDAFGVDLLAFNSMSADSELNIRGIFGNSGFIGIQTDFLTLIDAFGLTLAFTIDNDVALPVSQKAILPVNFNTKFVPVTNPYDSFSIEGEGATNINDPEIQFTNITTPLVLGFDRFNFDKSVIQTLPPIEQMGFVFGLLYRLRLSLANQNTALLGVGFDMQYFNNWFFELGTQTFLSQNSADTGGGLGQILTSVGNTYVLSGQGLYGYNALLDCGFTINTPIGAVGTNSFSFSQKEGELLRVRTISAIGQSTFEITSAQKNQAELVSPSIAFAVGIELIDYPAPALGNDNNAIFTLDPTLDCTSFYIGALPTFTANECMTTFLVGNGVFNVGIDLSIFIVCGLTITMPLFASSNLGDAYGLFQRDFSGLNGNNVSTYLEINAFRINVTTITNSIIQPYGSNALFNIAVNGFIPSIPAVRFIGCDFGTDEVEFATNPSPLDLLLPVLSRCQDGITFQNTTFHYVATPSTPTIRFNINNDATFGVPTQSALLGTSIIQNTTFNEFGGDRISLRTNYNGGGDTLSSLAFINNAELTEVVLANSSTAVPPPCGLNFNNNPLLTEIVFTAYNMTSFTITGTLPLVSILEVQDNDLPSADLDSIIVALDNNGLNNGTLDYSNQTGGASPNIGVSGVAYNNLIVKGWTVTGNVPI